MARAEVQVQPVAPDQRVAAISKVVLGQTLTKPQELSVDESPSSPSLPKSETKLDVIVPDVRLQEPETKPVSHQPEKTQTSVNPEVETVNIVKEPALYAAPHKFLADTLAPRAHTQSLEAAPRIDGLLLGEDDLITKAEAARREDFEAFLAEVTAENNIASDPEDAVITLEDYEDYPLLKDLDFEFDSESPMTPTLEDGAAPETLTTEELPKHANVVDELAVRTEAVEAQEALVADWAAELEKDPEELFADFTEALQLFTELPKFNQAVESDNVAEPFTDLTELSFDDEIVDGAVLESQVESDTASDEPMSSETKIVPTVLTQITEKLTQLEPADKELVAPIMKDIVGAIHGLKILESRQADPEVIASVETQLEELCMTLFETIGVTYEPEDIEQFFHMLLGPEFKLPPTVARQAQLDLRYVGTREAKGYPWRVSGDTAGVGLVHRIVGALAVFSARSAAPVVAMRGDVARSYAQAA